MTNKQLLIQLYNETVLLGHYSDLERYATYPLAAIHPGKGIEELSEEELIKIISASVTNMTGQLC